MNRDFEQVEWDEAAAERCRRLAELALEEDIAGGTDHTAAISVPPDARGAAGVVARRAGVVAGLPTISVVIDVFGSDVNVYAAVADGQSIGPRTEIARLEGSVRDLLAMERTLLNFLGRLSGIASLTRQFVDAISGSGAKIYDTRKTTPGWRRLEKYAVRCGGGHNHRSGLDAAILVKDNHIAARRSALAASGQATLADLTRSARDYALTLAETTHAEPLIVEVEVDSLAQLKDVLAGRPDLVLLDNMDAETLRQAVSLRDRLAPDVQLEASGGVNLTTVRQIASTGVERISVGALTHQAVWLDIGLDWLD